MNLPGPNSVQRAIDRHPVDADRHCVTRRTGGDIASLNRLSLARGGRMLSCLMLISSLGTAVHAQTKLHDVEYAIISAVVDHGVGAGRNVVIDQMTTGESVDVFDPARSIEDLATDLGTTAAALREWSRLNRRRYPLQGTLAMSGTYSLLAEDERLGLFSDADPAANWQRFRAKFPAAAGIIRVSRPGIDDQAKAAVLYLEYECGAQCGSGRLVNVVLSDDGRWQVTAGELLWITAPE